jgi:hypothetical protein
MLNCLGAGKIDDATLVEPGKGTPKHFSVHADVHSENVYAVEYKGFSEQDEVMAKRM